GSFASSTLLGAAWWTGIGTLHSADYTVAYPNDGRIGAFVQWLPADVAQTNYWRGIALMATTGTDMDLELYPASWFGDPPPGSVAPKASLRLANTIDCVLIDGNRVPNEAAYLRINEASNTAASPYGLVSTSNPGQYVHADVGATLGPFALTAGRAM